MALINITLSSMIQYYNDDTAYLRYDGSASDAGNLGQTNLAAMNDAQGKASNGGGGNYVNIGSGGNSGNGKYFGTDLGIKYAGTPSITSSVYVGTPEEGNGHWEATAICYGGTNATAYQLKLVFTLPDVPSSLINNASISINYSASGVGSSGKSCALYAPKSGSNLTDYLRPSDSSILSRLFTFTATNGSNTITNNLTDALKLCIDKGLGWLTLGYNSDVVTGDFTVTVTNVTITYTLKYTLCTAPNSISSSVNILKPNGNINISWSGATAGNNMTILDYTIYWKVDDIPTTSSYSGSAILNTSPYSFTIPSNATRGSTYYFKIVTNGSVSGYSSDISSAQAEIKVNTLPAVPTVTITNGGSRVPSTGGTVTFSITAGSDPDTGQTLKTYWATSTTGQKTEVLNNSYTTPVLSSATTYYFWTFDGIEYSSSYVNKTITVNIPPSISSFNMTAIATYVPTILNRSYVKNIRIDAPTITKDPAATLTYDWRFLTGTATSSGTPSTEENIFGHASSYSNFDVTTGGVGFNNSYKLQLTITDDLGETATLASTNTFCIPAAPTIVIYNQKANSNVSTANYTHFGRYIRVKYSEENNGLTKELLISTFNNFASYNSINLTGTINTDVDLNSLIHGTVYYFLVKYICNSIYTYAIFNPAEGSPSHPNYISRTRSSNITPQTITVTPLSGSSIKPYTNTLFNVLFDNLPLTFSNNLDVSTLYSEIYTISLEYGGRSLNLVSNGSVSLGMVTSSCTLNDKSTLDWITLISGSGSIAPNSIYNVSLKIIALNEFGELFLNIATIALNFIEGIYDIGNVSLLIKTNANSWKTIPTDNYQGASLEERYPTFETQTLRISYSNLKIYANLIVTIYFMNGNSVLNSTLISETEWLAPSVAGNYIYSLNGTKYVEYTLPFSNIALVRNYSVRIVLANENEGSIISTNSTTNNNLNTTSIHRFSPASINFAINTVSENSNLLLFNAAWSCTDFGGSIENTKYSNSYSTIEVLLQCCNTPTGTYTNIGNKISLSNVGSSTMQGTGNLSGSTASILYDIVYFGVIVTVTLRFTSIDGAFPDGTDSYIYSYQNQKVLYRATPNLLYGKNYFVLNATTPTSGITDQILELHGTLTRNTIYIGDLTKAKLTITNNGLTIDNFIIDSGSWDSN